MVDGNIIYIYYKGFYITNQILVLINLIYESKIKIKCCPDVNNPLTILYASYYYIYFIYVFKKIKFSI